MTTITKGMRVNTIKGDRMRNQGTRTNEVWRVIETGCKWRHYDACLCERVRDKHRHILLTKNLVPV